LIGYIRSRQLRLAAVTSSIAIGLISTARDVTVPVVINPDPVSVRLALMSPLALIVAVAPTLVRSISESEKLFRPQLRLLRLCHLLAVTGSVCLLAVVVFSTWGDPTLASQAVRNTVLLLGILLLSNVLLRDLAWTVPTLFAGVCYAVGYQFDLARAHTWAFLLRPFDWWSVTVSVVSFLLGAGVFVLVDDLHDLKLRRKLL
jgi:hypothetical protein